MNYLALCRQLAREVGASAPIGSVEDQRGEGARLCHFIAEADFAIATMWDDWHFAWATHETRVMGGAALIDDLGTSVRREPVSAEIRTLDQGMLSWRSIGEDTCRALGCVGWPEYAQRHACRPLPVGTPSCISRRPDGAVVMDVVPATDGDLSIAYWRHPQRLAQNLDESMVPAAYRRAIVLQAKLYYAEHEDAAELYQPVAAELGEWLQRLESSQLPSGEYRRRSELPDDALLVQAL